ncbi:hypothetical protein QU38_01110, partial [Staphylococcus aureus]
RNLHPLLELRLDLEALGRADVFQVDAAEGRLQRGHGLDHALDRVGGDLDVEHVDIGALLEENGFAFHHRLGGQRTDVAKAQHRGAVRHHRHQVGAARQGCGLARIFGDDRAGRSNARRIGQREVALVRQRLDRLDLELT